MNRQQLVDEGNRLDAALAAIHRIATDPEAIPEQLKIVRANSEVKMARLELVRALLDKECDVCGHGVKDHIVVRPGAAVHGVGGCTVYTAGAQCVCTEWEVDA